MSDDTPTQRFDQQPGVPVLAQEEKKRGPLIPILIVVGALLLVGVVVLGSLLLNRNSANPTAIGTNVPSTTGPDGNSTPVPVPTVTVTVTPTASPVTPPALATPVGNNVLIQQYSITPLVVDCSSGAPAGSDNLHITWKSVNTQATFFGINTVDAQAGGMGWMDLPASGTQHNFPSGYDPYTYPCGSAQESYTFTMVGQASKQSLTITVKRK